METELPSRQQDAIAPIVYVLATKDNIPAIVKLQKLFIGFKSS